MKKKKASLFFMPLVVIISFIVLIYLYYVLLNKSGYSIKNPIGSRQFDLLKTYTKAESTLLYIDQSAKYSLQQAVYELAGNGGYYDKPDCGSYGEFDVWAAIENKNNQINVRKCYPEDLNLKVNFLRFFNDTLNDYLANHPEVYIQTSYEYYFRNNELIGKSAENLIFDITSEKAETVKPAKETKTAGISYQTTGELPQILRVPMKSKPDVETIKEYHPEVWANYAELCKKMGSTPGICTAKTAKCCVTTGGGYRHPAYNKEKGNVDNSPHQYGIALDIHVGRDVKEQIRWAKEARESGLFTRAGIYPGDTHIHVDTMPLQGQYALPYWIGRKNEILAKANTIAELENKASQFT